MALISTDDLVIKTGETGSSDRICTIITREKGVIRAFANGAKNIKNKNHAATNQFVYSDFVLFKGRESYTVNEADIKENFGMRLDGLEKLALAQYFGELCITLAADNAGDEGFLRLMLNALHLLAGGKYSFDHIKAVTELRMMCLGGYMPNLVMCAVCGCFEAEEMYFYPATGKIFCKKCRPAGYAKNIRLSLGALTAMRHICYSPFEKIFSFSLSDENEKILADATETFLLAQTERTYKTLDFYHNIL